MMCTPHPILFGNNEMGGACRTYGEEDMCIQVLVGKPEGKNDSEDPGIDGRII
jgi:hypothetical protein